MEVVWILMGASLAIAALNWAWYGIDHLEPNVLGAILVVLPTVFLAIGSAICILKAVGSP